MDKKLFVYISIEKHDYLLGTIYLGYSKGEEIYSFEYSNEAFDKGLQNIFLDTSIEPISGRQFKVNSNIPYGFMKDSSPDRWGRNLIKKNNKDKFLFETDYLLKVSDISRMGALRFKEDLNGNFLSSNSDIPQYKYIRELEQVAFNFDDFDESDEWKMLLSPGSSMGGARPKAVIYDNDNQIFIAKFNHKNDEYDISKVEYLTYLLAKDCGINMSESRLVELSKNRSVFLTKRFDRNSDERIHYASFMNLLGAQDGDSNNYSYLDLVECITKYSSSTSDDLKELFKRAAFSLLVHNYDNHLRNHGLLFKNKKWSLSPCFDVNIVPYKGRFAVSIDKTKQDTVAQLIETAPYYRIAKEDAEKMINEMRQIIINNLDKHMKAANLEQNLSRKIKSLLSESEE